MPGTLLHVGTSAVNKISSHSSYILEERADNQQINKNTQDHF